MATVQDHMCSILKNMAIVEGYVLSCLSENADSDLIHNAIASIADITRNAVHSSAAFCVGNGDTHMYLADTHRSLAEFHGLVIYLELLSRFEATHSNVYLLRSGLGEFRHSFSSWVQTLRNICEIFGVSSEVWEILN